MALELHLLRPLWLLALLPLALLLLALRRPRAGVDVWRSVVDAHLLPHLLVGTDGRPRRLPLFLLGLGWFLLVLALAGPVLQRLPQPVVSAIDARVILLDLSPTMNVGDLAPSRLARARFEVLDLLRAAKEGQVALIAFGPEPFVVSPLTSDAKTIAAQVPQLSTDLLPVPGARRTDLALERATELLEQAGAKDADLILVTDGLGGMAGALERARRLQAAGHRLSVLAVGTAAGGPVPAEGGGFEHERGGEVRIARLDAERLRALARAGGGRFLQAEVGERDTQALLTRGAASRTQVEETALTADQWREEGPWLLLLLLPVAALAFRRGWLLPVVLMVSIIPPNTGWAASWTDLWQRADQQGAQALAEGDPDAAAARFEDPAWRAAASYRAGDFAAALEALTDLDGADAAYNRGNALARLGRLDEAIAAYETALEQAPDHADARHNLDLVRAAKEREPPPDRQDDGSSDDSGKKDSGSEDSSQGDAGHDDSGADGSSPGDSGQGDAGKDDSGQGAPETGEADAAQGANGSEAPSDPGAQDAPSSDGASGKIPPDQGAHGGESTGSGSSKPPDASDLGADAGEPPREMPAPDTDASQTDAQTEGAAGADRAGETGTASPKSELDGAEQGAMTGEARERQQAMEAQLRRVPDDPAGLLRQRFLLQHLRREGRLP